MLVLTLRPQFNIKRFMAAYLAFLFAWSVAARGEYRSAGDAILLVIGYGALDVFWTYLRDRVWFFPLSSVISALVLANVALPLRQPFLLAALPIVAVASKQLLRFGSMRHLLNPAGFAMLAISVFTRFVPTWDGAARGVGPLIAIAVLGLIIVWRLGRFHIALPFLAAYALFLAVSFASSVPEWHNLPAVLWPQLRDGTLLFFTTVMLVEPVTTTFVTRAAGSGYGILVAAVAAFSGRFLPTDPLLTGLIAGNLLFGLRYAPRR